MFHQLNILYLIYSGIFVMKLMQSHDGDKQHLFKPVSTLFLTPTSIFLRFMSTQKYIYILIQRSEFHILKFGTTKFISVLVQSLQFQISKFSGSAKCNYVLVQSS